MPRPRAHTSAAPPIAIAVSRYNASITDRLLQGALRAYQAAGGDPRHLHIAEAAGAFELLPLAAAAARSGAFPGILALGCIIKGQTRHDEFLAHAVTSGLAHLSVSSGLPIGLGVLTVNSPAQARDRAGGRAGDKGRDAMSALLAAIAEVHLLADPRARAAARREGLSLQRLTRPSFLAHDKASPPARRSRKGRP